MGVSKNQVPSFTLMKGVYAMNRYDFYNNLELFHKTKEIIQQEEQEKIQNDLNELKHYGTLGQKWGVRKWQNYDGTFNEAGKERYFGKSSQTTSTEEDKVGSARSDVKEYLKFRNKMLKKRTHGDLNKWYRDNNKAADKQLLKDAKKVDKQREKMYKNQLKDFYDDPNELVSDLDRIYKIGSNEQKIGSTNYTWDRMDNVYKYDDKYQNADGTLTKKGQKLLDKGKNTEGLINMDLYDKSKYTDEDWDNEIKKSEEHQKKLVDDAKAKVKTTKELSGDTINDQEFKDIIEEVNNSYYYTKMAIAWLLCELMIKYRTKLLNYLKESNLDDFTINKGIQKMRESFRVSDSDKEYLLKFKR